jgi:hypothetical protein
MSHNGKHVPPHERTGRRNRTIAIVAAFVLVAFAGGFLLASDLGEGDPTVGPTTTTPAGSSATAPTSAAPSGAVGDGEHFVQPTSVARFEGGTAELAFNLATFLTGAEAQAYAEEEGIELEQDYLIVDDGPEVLRTPLAVDVAIEYIPEGTCCEPQPGTLDAFDASVNRTQQTDYPDPATTWWWATVEDGAVTRLVQQYLP